MEILLKTVGIIGSIIALFGTIVTLLLKRQAKKITKGSSNDSGGKPIVSLNIETEPPIGEKLTGQHTYKLLNKIIIAATVIAILALISVYGKDILIQIGLINNANVQF